MIATEQERHISMERLLQEVSQLETPDLDVFLDQFLRLRIERYVSHLSRVEAEFILKTNAPVSEETWKRLKADKLTKAEYAELRHLVDEVEIDHAQCVRHLAELARLRETTEEALMESLGISLPLPVPKPSSHPDPKALAVKLRALITTSGISPEKAGTPWLPWRSGVYALIDCIFSSQSDYHRVVLPLLRRLAARPDLRDEPGLRFSAFVADVDTFGADKFEQYAVQVLTRNKISGRLKVEICYEAANFFARHGLETMADLQNLGSQLEPLILDDFQASIHGVGPTLAHYLLTLFGNEDHIKLDIMITRFWKRMNDWCPRASNERDYQIALDTFRNVAVCMESTPARLDNAIWRYESSQVGRRI